MTEQAALDLRNSMSMAAVVGALKREQEQARKQQEKEDKERQRQERQAQKRQRQKQGAQPKKRSKPQRSDEAPMPSANKERVAVNKIASKTRTRAVRPHPRFMDDITNIEHLR